MEKYFVDNLPTPLTEGEMMSMCNLCYKSTGIDNVAIWIGPDPDGKRTYIKVSNVPNHSDINDCFTITIPNLEVIGYVNRTLITDDALKQLFEFIKINYNAIIEYSSEIGLCTGSFIDKLIQVK